MGVSRDEWATVLSFAEKAAPYLLALVQAKGEKQAIASIKALTASRRAARDERIKKKFKPRKKPAKTS